RHVTVPVGGPWSWRIAGAGPLVAVGFGETAQPSRKPAHDRQRDRWVLGDDRLEVPRREGETHGRLVGHDLCDTRPPVQDRQLPEEVARTEARDGRSIADDADCPP